MENVFNLSLLELEQYFIEKKISAYRVKQAFDWLYKKRVSSFKQMKNIKKETIIELEKSFSFSFIKLIESKKDKDAAKFLFQLSDKNIIEAVLLKQKYGNSLCISTQVGCNMSCLFCESGRLKKIRNLEVFEMVQQILLIEKEMDIRISHVVIMGIGEPFDNYDNVLKFIKLINDSVCLAIGARHITVSTCGLVPQIYQFADQELQVNLAVSLNAAEDQLRNQLMPINRAFNLNELIRSVKYYVDKTNRRVTFEYVMLKGINDSEQAAKQLISLIRGINCYVNLIPYNPTNNSNFSATSKDNILKFYDIIKKNKINVTIRKELGANLLAACGQLRVSKETK